MRKFRHWQQYIYFVINNYNTKKNQNNSACWEIEKMTSYLCGFIVHTRWVQNIWVTTPLSSQVGPSDTIQKWSQPSGHCTVYLLWLYAFSCTQKKKERREQQHNVFYLFCVISGLQKNITLGKWQRKWQLKIFDSWIEIRELIQQLLHSNSPHCLLTHWGV